MTFTLKVEVTTSYIKILKILCTGHWVGWLQQIATVTKWEAFLIKN